MSSKKYNNIILIGYRGTGKSVVSALLQKKTQQELICTDCIIEEKYGQIADIIEQEGWERFRKIETQVIKAISISNGIIDCGGGVVERPENITYLKSIGIIFWLKAEISEIIRRIQSKTNRPPLTNSGNHIQEVNIVLKRREPLYSALADHEINTDNKSPEEIANKIIEIMNSIKGY